MMFKRNTQGTSGSDLRVYIIVRVRVCIHVPLSDRILKYSNHHAPLFVYRIKMTRSYNVAALKRISSE